MMNKKSSLVSVIMPAHNVEKYIDEAILSILNQSFKDFELIIVNDASNDNTGEIIEGYAKKDSRITCIHNKSQQKMAKSLNIAIQKSKGKYIARMDSDDWAYPNRLKTQVKFLEKNSEVSIVGGSIDICESNLKVINERHYLKTDGEIRANLFRFSPFCHPSIMVRSEHLIQAGCYDGYYLVADDYDMYFRIGHHGKMANLPDKLMKYRVHYGSISHVKGSRQEFETLFIRLKAVLLYGYKMSFFDKIYFLGQLLSVYLIPYRVKFWIFNKIRAYLQ